MARAVADVGTNQFAVSLSPAAAANLSPPTGPAPAAPLLGAGEEKTGYEGPQASGTCRSHFYVMPRLVWLTHDLNYTNN